jgi:hypothetical protein
VRVVGGAKEGDYSLLWQREERVNVGCFCAVVSVVEEH